MTPEKVLIFQLATSSSVILDFVTQRAKSFQLVKTNSTLASASEGIVFDKIQGIVF